MLAHLLLLNEPSFDEAHRVVAELPDARTAPRLLPGGGRMLRSHERWRSEYHRTLYLVRDPRDVAVSYYRYRRWLREFSGSFDAFLELFLAGEVDSYGRWDAHVESWLVAPQEETLILRFEDVVADPAMSLTCAARFLGISASGSEVAQAVAGADIANMRKKEQSVSAAHFARADSRVGGFVGSGKAGGWRSSSYAAQLRSVTESMGRTIERMSYSVTAPATST